MMNVRLAPWLLGLSLVGLAWPAAAEMDGRTWMRQSEEFKRGYLAGHLNTMTVLGMSLIPGGALSDERARTLEVIGSMTRYQATCVHRHGITALQLEEAVEKYLQKHPSKANDLMFITAGLVLDQTCTPRRP